MRYTYEREDVARHGPALEAALRRDIRASMSSYMDYFVLRGGGSGGGLRIGLAQDGSTAVIPDANRTDIKAVGAGKPTRADLLSALTSMLDGTYAARPEHLKILLNRTVHDRIMVDIGNAAADSYTVLELAKRIGFMFQVSDHMPSADAAGSTVGIVSKARGLMGTCMFPVWDAAQMIVDPYTDSDAAQINLTLHVLFAGPWVTRADNWRRLKTAA